MALIPPSFFISGDENRAISLRAQASQFYNFVANQAEIGGVNLILKNKILEDGSIISIRTSKEGLYGHRTGTVSIFGSGGLVETPLEKLFSTYAKTDSSSFLFKDAVIPDVTDDFQVPYIPRYSSGEIAGIAVNTTLDPRSSTLYRSKQYWYNIDKSICLSWNTSDIFREGKKILTVSSTIKACSTFNNKLYVIIIHPTTFQISLSIYKYDTLSLISTENLFDPIPLEEYSRIYGFSSLKPDCYIVFTNINFPSISNTISEQKLYNVSIAPDNSITPLLLLSPTITGVHSIFLAGPPAFEPDKDDVTGKFISNIIINREKIFIVLQEIKQILTRELILIRPPDFYTDVGTNTNTEVIQAIYEIVGDSIVGPIVELKHRWDYSATFEVTFTEDVIRTSATERLERIEVLHVISKNNYIYHKTTTDKYFEFVDGTHDINTIDITTTLNIVSNTSNKEYVLDSDVGLSGRPIYLKGLGFLVGYDHRFQISDDEDTIILTLGDFNVSELLHRTFLIHNWNTVNILEGRVDFVNLNGTVPFYKYLSVTSK